MNYKLTARELSSFCGQMGMLLHSGISTTEGLHILCDESKTDTDREILTPLIRSVEENGSLSQALEEVGCFPASMTAYVKTGEETGCLDEIMNSLSEHYKQEQEISADPKRCHLSSDHAWHDGSGNSCSSGKSPSCFSAGVSADGTGNERGFPGTPQCRQCNQSLLCRFFDSCRCSDWLHPFFQPYRKRPLKPPETGYPSAHIS